MAKPSFDGLRVLSLESRRATEIARLIETFGGRPTVAPALQEVPLSSNDEALAFAEGLARNEYDVVIFLTGTGAHALFDLLGDGPAREAFLAALRRVKVVVRGPKPLAMMREWNVPVWATAPEPNTWRELLAALDARAGELPAQPRIAVQEYGACNTDLLDALRAQGAIVTRVPIYKWALPDDVRPLTSAIHALARGEIDVALFTTQVQVAHLFFLAASMTMESEVQAGLTRAVVASIGPTTSEALRGRSLPVDLEASHPKMGVLVTEAAEQAQVLLAAKRPRPT